MLRLVMLGVFLVIAPWGALAAIGVFAVIVAITRYVSLASILAAASFPIFAWFFVQGDKPAFSVAVQIIAQFGDEATIFRLAAQIETTRPWKDRLPPLMV